MSPPETKTISFPSGDIAGSVIRDIEGCAEIPIAKKATDSTTDESILFIAMVFTLWSAKGLDIDNSNVIELSEVDLVAIS